MTRGIYLAIYKGKGDWVDKLVRFFTKGKYSHCEIAVKKSRIEGHYDYQEWYECYSSSPRDGGVRCKIINVADPSQWDLIELKNVEEAQIQAYFERTKGRKYDFWGAVGVVLGFKQHRERFFCSEWCWQALGGKDGWRFSPNELAIILQHPFTYIILPGM